MTVHTERTPGGVVMVEVRDGRGHLIEEGHVLPPDGDRSSRIVWGNRTLSIGVLKDLLRAELALLTCAEELDRRRA